MFNICWTLQLSVQNHILLSSTTSSAEDSARSFCLFCFDQWTMKEVEARQTWRRWRPETTLLLSGLWEPGFCWRAIRRTAPEQKQPRIFRIERHNHTSDESSCVPETRTSSGGKRMFSFVTGPLFWTRARLHGYNCRITRIILQQWIQKSLETFNKTFFKIK